MLVLVYAFALLVLLAAAYAFVRPFTKEKFFFLAVAVVQLLAVLLAPPPSPDGLEAEMAQVQQARAATVPGEGFPAFLAQLQSEATGSGAAARRDAVAAADAPATQGESAVGDGRLAAVLQAGYPLQVTSKPLFFREIVMRPLGRVTLPPPSTPGVEVVTTWSPLGPDFSKLSHRQPLGILDPLPGQSVPPADEESR